MPQVTDPRAPSSPQSVQDVFLDTARRDRLVVEVHLMEGRHFAARIKGFDRFAVVFDVDGADHLVFKHAIATIEAPSPVATAL